MHDQVRRHHHGVGEPDANEPGIGGSRSDLGACSTARSGPRATTSVTRERRLQIGLVPARERPPGVGGLEVRGDDDVLGAVVGASYVDRYMPSSEFSSAVPSSATPVASDATRRRRARSVERAPSVSLPASGVGHRPCRSRRTLLVGTPSSGPGVTVDLGARRDDLGRPASCTVHRERRRVPSNRSAPQGPVDAARSRSTARNPTVRGSRDTLTSPASDRAASVLVT